MMKKIGIVTGLLVISLAGMACDICGSGSGSTYMGLLPQFRKKFIGLRYQQNSLITHLGQGGANTYLTTTENFRKAELWGAINIGSRFRISGFIPYNFMERRNQQEELTHHGIGDLSIVGYYRVLTKEKTLKNKSLNQSLWVGGGLKIPTGEYNPDGKNIVASSQNTFQLGTGSLDFSLHAMHDIRLNNAGLNTNLSYTMTSRNKYGYKYGNKISMNILGYYRVSIGEKITLAPNAGLQVEQSGKDQKTSDISVWDTGGRSLMGTLGLELNAGKINIGANWQSPLSQELGEGKLRANERMMVHLSLSL